NCQSRRSIGDRQPAGRQAGRTLMNLPFGLTGLIAIAAAIYVVRAVRIVRQYEKGLVETFGQFSRRADAGLVLLFPPFQNIRMVDMREQVMDVPPQEVITKDNASVTVDAVIYFQVTDPAKVVYKIGRASCRE